MNKWNLKLLALICSGVLITACGSDSGPSDKDKDGLVDTKDNCQTVANADQADLDSDGIGDACDDDIDGDDVINSNDAFPEDPSETSDIDGDGIGDNTDDDIDGDGVLNGSDDFPKDPTETVDADEDGVGDNQDLSLNNDNLAYVELERLIETKRISTTFVSTVRADRLGNYNTFVNLGDTNGDGKDDIAVVLTGNGTTAGSSGYLWEGTYHVHLILGGTELPEIVDKTNIQDYAATTFEVADFGTTGNDISNTRLNKIQVMPGGDLNNDGKQDLVIFVDGNSADNNGILYYVYGRDAWPALVAESQLATSYGFSISNSPDLEYKSYYLSMGPIGDVNGDGFQDVYVGTDAYSGIYNELNMDDLDFPYRENPPYILFGNTTGLSGELDLSALNAGQGTMLLDSNNTGRSGLGGRFVQLGNFNGDQFDDFAILDMYIRSDQDRADYLYIVYGKDKTKWQAQTDLADLTLSEGAIISGIIDSDNDIYYRMANGRYSSNQDFNGDGLNDLFMFNDGRQLGTAMPLDLGWESIIWGGQSFNQLNTNLRDHADELLTYLPDGVNRRYGDPHFLSDLNGDNTAELVYGIAQYDGNNLINGEPDDVKTLTEGGVFVIYGNQPFYDDLDFTNITAEQGYFIHNKQGDGEEFGRTVGSLKNWQSEGATTVFITQPSLSGAAAVEQARVYLMEIGGSLYGD